MINSEPCQELVVALRRLRVVAVWGRDCPPGEVRDALAQSEQALAAAGALHERDVQPVGHEA